MSSYLSILIGIFCLMTFSSSTLPGPSYDLVPTFNIPVKDSQSWESVKSKNDITILAKEVEFDTGQQARFLRGSFLVNATPDELISMLQDGDELKSWIYGAKESKTLDYSPSSWVSYAQFNVPWPFSDQDLILSHEILKQTAKEVLIFSEGVPSRLPEREGIKRMKNFKGYWTMTALDDGRTMIEHGAMTFAVKKAPAGIQKKIAISAFWNSLNNLVSLIDQQNESTLTRK